MSNDSIELEGFTNQQFPRRLSSSDEIPASRSGGALTDPPVDGIHAEVSDADETVEGRESLRASMSRCRRTLNLYFSTSSRATG